MTIVIISSPACDGIDQETKQKFGWSFFGQLGNLEDQWKVLEGMRVTGGLIFAQPCGNDSALYELVKPYLDENGYIGSTGLKKVNTEEHGTFDVFLYAHVADSKIKPYEPICEANWNFDKDSKD